MRRPKSRGGRWDVLLLLAVLLSCSVRPAGLAGLPGAPQLGAAPRASGAAALPGDSENIRWADHFPGSDLGAQINAADSDLGKERGEIRVGRPGTVETRVTLTANHVLRLLAPTTWQAGIQAQSGTSVLGNGCASLLTLVFRLPASFITASNMANIKVADLCAEAALRSNRNILLTVSAAQGIELTGCRTANIRLGEFNNSSDVKVIGNTATAERNDPSTGTAVSFSFTHDALAAHNTIRGFAHGLQWWGGDANPKKGGAAANPRGARRLSFVGNSISDVGGGGIWGSMGEGIAATGNVIENCGDVCLDSEGSNSVVFSNNYVKDGANGAITTFYYNRDVLITGNTVVSSSAAKPLLRTYTTGQDQPFDRDVQVVGNHFACLDASPCFINSVAGLPERFIFKDNALRNVALDLSAANPKHFVLVSGNDFLFDVPSPKPLGAISVAHTNALGRGVAGDCEISNNTVRSNVRQPARSAAIWVLQDDPAIAPLTLIEGNHLLGLYPFPIDIAVGGASKNPSVTPLFLIRNNLMGAGALSRLDQSNPRSNVKLEGNYRSDSAPFLSQ